MYSAYFRVEARCDWVPTVPSPPNANGVWSPSQVPSRNCPGKGNLTRSTTISIGATIGGGTPRSCPSLTGIWQAAVPASQINHFLPRSTKVGALLRRNTGPLWPQLIRAARLLIVESRPSSSGPSVFAYRYEIAKDVGKQSEAATAVLIYRKLRKPALGPVGDSLDDMGATT